MRERGGEALQCAPEADLYRLNLRSLAIDADHGAFHVARHRFRRTLAARALRADANSARTIHFIGMSLIVLFILVHLIEVIISGFFNECAR